jgi:hypothetical protein
MNVVKSVFQDIKNHPDLLLLFVLVAVLVNLLALGVLA